MANFRVGAASFYSTSCVTVQSAFELAADRDREFDEGSGFWIERARVGGGVAERIVSGEDLGEIFLEFQKPAGELSGRRRFGFAHGARVAECSKERKRRRH